MLRLKLTTVRVIVLTAAAAACRAGATVVTYPAPPGAQASADYTVEAGGQNVCVYTAPVLRGGPASFASFDCSGPLAVSVTCQQQVDSVKVLPTSYAIHPAISGNRLTLMLTNSANLTIELNGRFEHPLHLFVNPLEIDRPDPADKNVIYFGPGVHQVATIRPKSGQTVYLAGGAILRAKIPPDEKPIEEMNWRGNKVYATLIETSGVQGVTVRGRGILDLGALPQHARTAMWFGDSQDIQVEGIIILDAPNWGVAMHNSKHVVVRNVKEICARENSDGVDISNSQDIRIEDCFFRNNDDEVCVKTLSRRFALESKDIVVRRCVVWNDRARGLGITVETRANISNVLFKNCDIIHDFASASDCAALAIIVCDSGTISDIRFEDIRVEDCANTLVNCWIGPDTSASNEPRGHIKDVTFKNITFTAKDFPAIKLNGGDATHLIEDVHVERVRMQGTQIRDATAGNLQTNAFVRGLQFD